MTSCASYWPTTQFFIQSPSPAFIKIKNVEKLKTKSHNTRPCCEILNYPSASLPPPNETFGTKLQFSWKCVSLRHTPANGVDVLRVGLVLRLAQAVSQGDETLSEALVDGAAGDGNGCPGAQRQEACGEEEPVPPAPPSGQRSLVGGKTIFTQRPTWDKSGKYVACCSSGGI